MRHRTAKSFTEDYIIYIMDDTPKIIEELYSSLYANLWKEAIKSEIDLIMANETWEVVTYASQYDVNGRSRKA